MMSSVSSEPWPPQASGPSPRAGSGRAAAESGNDCSSELARLYTEHFAFVWRSARRLGVPLGAVDDAVQDVFLVAHRKLGEFEGRSSLRTWLFGIARKVARDYRRTRSAEARETPDLDALPTTDSGPLLLAERAEGARLMQALLDELDDDRRDAFILVDLEELSVPEAAEALGVNLNTLYSRVRAARQDLSQALARKRARNQRREPWNR
jgi:RNA polymerase sigma-70 factor (ECF subfamily)